MAPDFSQFDRPDQNPRLTARRRLPHPTSASATSSTIPNGNVQPTPHIVTYSEFLGTFDDAPTPFMNQPPSLASFLADSFVPFTVVDIESLPGGSSRPYTNAFANIQPSNSVVENGWIEDVFGNIQYVGHGKIEEVDDDAEELKSGDDEGLSTPRAKGPGSRQSLPSIHNTDTNSNSNIPLNSTPPPCPRPKKLPSLRETATVSNTPSIKATSTVTPAMDPPTSTPNNPATFSTGLDETTEVSLVKENLELLSFCVEDVKFMNTYFLAQSIDDDLSQHIDVCSHIEEFLGSLHEILTHRARMGEEEWNVRSSSWHQKYSKRLVSLRTTLQRLTRVRQLLETQALRPRQRQAILTKLEQHEAKLKDLSSKFTVSFDRLRLRHLHFLLSQSHHESKRQKTEKTRLLSRASFERQWQASKSFRAGLRHAFNDLRQEFYNNPHSGRHPSAP